MLKPPPPYFPPRIRDPHSRRNPIATPCQVFALLVLAASLVAPSAAQVTFTGSGAGTQVEICIAYGTPDGEDKRNELLDGYDETSGLKTCDAILVVVGACNQGEVNGGVDVTLTEEEWAFWRVLSDADAEFRAVAIRNARRDAAATEAGKPRPNTGPPT